MDLKVFIGMLKNMTWNSISFILPYKFNTNIVLLAYIVDRNSGKNMGNIVNQKSGKNSLMIT